MNDIQTRDIMKKYYTAIYFQESKITISGERKLALNLRIASSIIGTLMVLGVTMQMDNFNFTI